MTNYLSNKIRKSAVLISEGMDCETCKALCPMVALKCDELWEEHDMDCEDVWRAMLSKVVEERE